jgi:hypothetical protein
MQRSWFGSMAQRTGRWRIPETRGSVSVEIKSNLPGVVEIDASHYVITTPGDSECGARRSHQRPPLHGRGDWSAQWLSLSGRAV